MDVITDTAPVRQGTLASVRGRGEMKMKTTKGHVKIDLRDVVNAGGVSEAIIAWAAESDDTSSGVIGSSFSCSGPGAGWQKNHDASDYSARAFEGGALYYIDEDDGRMIGVESAEDAERDEDGELPEGVHSDISGCLYRVGDWSDESVVELVCPDVDDALENPNEVAEMAKAVIDTHGPMSDKAEWKKLIESIKDAAEALEDIDADELAD